MKKVAIIAGVVAVIAAAGAVIYKITAGKEEAAE